MKLGRLLLAVLAGVVLVDVVHAEEIVVGVQIPLSGPVAAIAGPRARHGVDIAVQEINSSGMLGPGRTIKALIEDNAGDKTQAITLANRFMSSDKVSALIGVFGSGLSVPVAPIANDLKTPFLAFGSSPGIVEPGPWGFCLFYQSEKQVAITSDLAMGRLGVRSLAIIFDKTNDGSVRMKNSLEAQVRARGGQIVSSDGITPTDTNFGPLATKLASMKFDALYVESNPAVGANVFVQVRQAGVGPNVKFLGAPQMNSPVLMQIGGKAVDGMFMPTPYHAGMPSPENKAFVDEFRKRTSSDPDLPSGGYYASMMLIAHAIRNAGPGADRQKIRDALAALKNTPSVLGQGKYSFDVQRFGEYQDGLVQIADGKAKYVPLN